MSKLNNIFLILLISLSLKSQSFNDEFKIEISQKDIDIYKFRKIKNEKLKECNCKIVNSKSMNYHTTINLGREILLSNNYYNYYMLFRKFNVNSFPDRSLNYNYILVSKNLSFKLIDSFITVRGIQIDSFFIINPFIINPILYDKSIPDKFDKYGYLEDELLMFTYATSFNRFLYNLKLINKFKYYRRLKCIDFKKLNLK